MNTDRNTAELKLMLGLAHNSNIACILLSNGFDDAYGKYGMLAGFGAKKLLPEPDKNNIENICFGILSYDLKNRFEKLSSENPPFIDVPDTIFFEPEKWFKKFRDGEIYSNLNEHDLKEASPVGDFKNPCPVWEKPNREEYLENVNSIRNDIIEGTYYELNYCTEWKAENMSDFDPYAAFLALNTKAPAPFAGFFKWGNTYLLCTSPERFFMCENDQIISQPIKGTRRRHQDRHTDSEVRTALMTSEKDRAENVMITDLVRNDISHFCEPGTVEVEELCGIHSFSHVHQMISTISGKIKKDTETSEIFSSVFPMGSMTGAPKLKVMENIERYENFKRGWYSGSLGYCEKNRMDFNVIIRSLQFESDKGRLAYHVGGAITFDSDPESEFQECMDKASGILSLFSDQD